MSNALFLYNSLRDAQSWNHNYAPFTPSITLRAKGSCLPHTKIVTTPFRPALAVLPIRRMYSMGSLGKSYSTTWGTSALSKSIPRELLSVQIKITGRVWFCFMNCLRVRERWKKNQPTHASLQSRHDTQLTQQICRQGILEVCLQGVWINGFMVHEDNGVALFPVIISSQSILYFSATWKRWMD